MKVESLTVKNFTVFDKAAFEFSPGINVLIGANATGKSHVLKLIYSVQHAIERSLGGAGGTGNGNAALAKAANDMFGQSIREKLVDIFKPADSVKASLIRTPLENVAARSDAKFSLKSTVIDFSGQIRQRGDFISSHDLLYEGGSVPASVFVPPREALALFEGFQFAYANRELSFDGTYNDLCLALSGSPLKGERAAWAKELIATLERELDGKVQLKNNRFYVGKFEAQLVAEGLRKVASIVQLLRNGAIGKGSVLLWDEPEGGLNPRLMKLIAAFLLQLASKGVQIFVATHDYLLTSELSLQAEYETPIGKAARPRFFCLARESLHAPVTLEMGDVLPDLKQNPILAEFAAHYDREQQLFVASGASDQ